jgi:hypothetical protein
MRKKGWEPDTDMTGEQRYYTMETSKCYMAVRIGKYFEAWKEGEWR